MDRKPIEFRQLCALVRAVLVQEPGMLDAEWKARVRDQLLKMQFEAPSADTLNHAMTRVEHAVRRTLGQRPIPGSALSPRKPEPPVSKARTHHPAGWDLVMRLFAAMQRSSGSAPSLTRPGGPREVLPLEEDVALNEFWRVAGEDTADRLALLRAVAEIAIVRPATWDVEQIRAEASQHTLSARQCFVCRAADRPMDCHHVIQIEFGGSNYIRNRVMLCTLCHRAVHPWLPAREPVSSWAHIADMFGKLRRPEPRRKIG